MKLNKMREEIKEEFLNALKADEIPWEKPWVGNGRPNNAINGKNYRGLNSFWLSYHQMIKGYEDTRWCTFKQAQDKGWKIKKGEKGVKVEFWSMYDTETKTKLTHKESQALLEQLGDRELFYERVKPISSVYVVFNGEQIEGIPEITFEKYELNANMLMEKRDVLLKNMDLRFAEEGDRAFYTPYTDKITMPTIEKFKSEYGYMSTFLHEAGHATGHGSRLNRDLEGGFGSSSYAKEELRAEIASAFVAQTLGISQTDAEHMENHKAYIQNWIEVLEKSPEELFAAMKDAEKIADYLIEKGEFEISQESNIEKHNVIENNENYLADLRINHGMDGLQLREIRYGLENNIDVSIYARPDYNFQQMEQIRLGMEQELDVSVYALPEFNFHQMNEIRLGLEQELDVTLYARPELDYLQMEQIKEGLEHGVNVNLYNNPNFDSLQMHIIRDGLESNIDVSFYAKPEFDHMQMSLMKDDIAKGLDVSVYANPEFDFHQMREIHRGLESGLDVSTYNNPEFNHMQMQEILEGLKSGINVSWYAKTDYNAHQMQMLREGLEQGVDISWYAKPELDSLEMAKIKDDLINRDISHEKVTNPKEISTQEFTASTDFYGLEQMLQTEPEDKIHSEQDIIFDNGDNYKLIQNVAEMEHKLNIPTDERLTEWYGDYAVYEMKVDVSVEQLAARYDSFKEHYMPLLSSKEAAAARLAVKGRTVEGIELHPVHIQVAELLNTYQNEGWTVKDIASNKLEEISSQIGSADINYTKNLVCSVAAKDRESYEQYMRAVGPYETEKMTSVSEKLAVKLKAEGLDVYSVKDSLLHNCDDINAVLSNPESEYFANKKQFETMIGKENSILPVIKCELSESVEFAEGKYYTISEFDQKMGRADNEWIQTQHEILEKYGGSDELLRLGSSEEVHRAMGYEKVKFTIKSEGREITDTQDIGDGDGSLIEHARTSLRSQVSILENAMEKEQQFEQQLESSMPKEVEPNLQDIIFGHYQNQDINTDIFPKDAGQAIKDHMLQQRNAGMKVLHHEMGGMGR